MYVPQELHLQVHPQKHCMGIRSMEKISLFQFIFHSFFPSYNLQEIKLNKHFKLLFIFYILINKLMMAAREHGHQPAQRLGWAALAYHKQKGAAPGPEPCKHSLQNEGSLMSGLG